VDKKFQTQKFQKFQADKFQKFQADKQNQISKISVREASFYLIFDEVKLFTTCRHVVKNYPPHP